MTPPRRKILYAVCFELLGILFGALVLRLMSGATMADTLSLSTLAAVIALAWNYLFNSLFEAWERRQRVKGRSVLRRSVHAVLFESGMSLILLPVTAWWLSATLRNAFFYEVSLIAFFFAYAWAFTWTFDLLFGLPDSAR